jgi:formylglycine-generating enzyme required for sulfatase activity
MTGTTCGLPTEAEWEYACRARTTTEYALPAPDGSNHFADLGLANCIDCACEWCGDRTAPVRSFPANAWGLHDMHGNVYEWVEDCWHASYEDAPQEGGAWLDEDSGDCELRVLRGGSWDDNQGNARCGNRNRDDPHYRSDSIGFRVVCSSPINEP